MAVNLLMVVLGGFFGTVARYKVSQWVADKFLSVFPYGTLFVNLLGSFLLGYLVGSEPADSVFLFLGTGFLGAFTTFSTFKVENVLLAMKKKWSIMLLYLSVSYVLGIALALLGYVIASKDFAVSLFFGN